MPSSLATRLEALRGRAVGDRLGVVVVLRLLHLAEVRTVEQLLEAHHLGAVGGGLTGGLLVLVDHRLLGAGPVGLQERSAHGVAHTPDRTLVRLFRFRIGPTLKDDVDRSVIRAISNIAATQQGLISAEQLTALGLSRSQLRTLARPPGRPSGGTAGVRPGRCPVLRRPIDPRRTPVPRPDSSGESRGRRPAPPFRSIIARRRGVLDAPVGTRSGDPVSRSHQHVPAGYRSVDRGRLRLYVGHEDDHRPGQGARSDGPPRSGDRFGGADWRQRSSRHRPPRR